MRAAFNVPVNETWSADPSLANGVQYGVPEQGRDDALGGLHKFGPLGEVEDALLEASV